LTDNFSFAEVPEAEVARLCEEVVREGSDAVVVLCTNMRGAALAERLEQKLGVGVFDSIAVTLWACLIATGVDPSVIHGWGSLFANSDLLSSRTQ
jgi:maleate isomerase